MRNSPFKVVKFGKKVGYFNFQKAQNLSGGFKMVALKQRMFICHLERARACFQTRCILKKDAIALV